jgi:hypothetical protein
MGQRGQNLFIVCSAFSILYILILSLSAVPVAGQTIPGPYASFEFKDMPSYFKTNIPSYAVIGNVPASTQALYINGANTHFGPWSGSVPVTYDFFSVINLNQGVNPINVVIVDSNGSSTNYTKQIDYDPNYSTADKKIVYANVIYQYGSSLFEDGVLAFDVDQDISLGIFKGALMDGMTRDGSKIILEYGRLYSTGSHAYTGQQLPVFTGRTDTRNFNFAYKPVFSHDGQFVYYKNMKVELSTNNITAYLPITIGSLADITPDDSRIVTYNGYVDLASNTFVSNVYTNGSRVIWGDLAVDPTGNYVLFSSYSYAAGRLTVLDINSAVVLRSIEYPSAGDFAGDIEFSPGGAKSYAGFFGNTYYGNGGIIEVDMATFGLDNKTKIHGSRSIAVAGDGKLYTSAFYTYNVGYKGDPAVRGIVELVPVGDGTSLDVSKVYFADLDDYSVYYGRDNIFIKTGVPCSSNIDCGQDGYVSTNYCSNDDVYQDYRTWTCNNAGQPNAFCSYTDTPQQKQDCGVDSCGPWGFRFCRGTQVFELRECIGRGCQNGNCINYTYYPERLVENCPNSCSNGACDIQCNTNNDCGNDGWLGQDYCNGVGNKDVWDDWRAWTCNSPGTSNSFCSSQDTPQLKTACAVDCANGACTSGTATLFVNPAKLTVFSPSTCNLAFNQVDYNFTSDVDINSQVDTYAGAVDILFNPNIVQSLGVSEGDFLKKDGASTYPVIAIDNTIGKITFANTRFNTQTGVSGSGSLASVVFKHVGGGLTSIDLQNAALSDPSIPPQPITATTKNGLIDVKVCYADVNRDGNVNIFDLATVGIGFGCQCGNACYNADADLNCDCVVDIFDLAGCGLGYGNTCSTFECQGSEQRLCPNQNGVCAGSFETCSNGYWPGCDYSTIPDYEVNDISCDDLDNDCDGNVDDDFTWPEIGFTHVPPYCSFQNLQGKACNVNPSNYRTACYIYVYGWWTKPYFTNPLNTINQDGSWGCDITTGGIDQKATKIKCFLVPVGYNPPGMSGGATLPAELDTNSVASIEVQRQEFFKTMGFSGYQWGVKDSCGSYEDPGPSRFTDNAQHIWVDSQGRLHLTIKKNGSTWYATEAFMLNSLGYGEYRFYTSSPVYNYDPNIVVGLFTYDHDPAYSHREIDLEFSRWGVPSDPNSQYVIQPWNVAGNRNRYNIDMSSVGPNTTYKYKWCPGSVFFQSIDGFYAYPPTPADEIYSWNFTGSVPPEGNEKARINMWQFNGAAPSDGQNAEMVIDRFEFAPTC